MHPVSSGDSSHPLWFDGDQLVHDDATEYLAYALRARAPEVPPNCPQQPTIATSSNLGTRA